MLAAAKPAAFDFVVISDTPYNKDDRAMLPLAAAKIKAEVKPPFIIHAGDMKGGGATCDTAPYDNFEALIDSLKPIPVFYTPGDNEWVDCDRGDYSELERLAYLKKRFFKDAPKNAAGLRYQRQAKQAENAAWAHAGVHFINLHIPGTNNARRAVTKDNLALAGLAADKRDALNDKWLKRQFSAAKKSGASAVVISIQADIVDPKDNKAKQLGAPCTRAYVSKKPKCDGYAGFRKELQAQAKRFDGVVLLIHGDTNPFTFNQDMRKGYGAANLWRLNGLGDGRSDVSLVSYDPKASPPFSARGLMTGEKPSATESKTGNK